jgi:hypothetical protein
MEEAAAEPLPENGNYALLKNSDAHNPATSSKRKWLQSYDEKRRYILNTNDIVCKELQQRLDLLASAVNKNGKRVVIYNPLPWKRSGLIENPWKKGSYCYIKEIPPSGYVSCAFDEFKEQNISNDEQSAFNTPYYKVVFDLTKGGISSLIEQSTSRELVDKSSAYVIGQFLHERFSTNEMDKWFNAYSRIKDGWAPDDLSKPE